MAKRRSFNDLSPKYQARILRKMSAEDFEAGVSLKAARGHAQTPERPLQAFRQPDVYHSYLTRSVAKGRQIPAEIAESVRITNSPAPQRRIEDIIGYPGKRAMTTAIFTLAKGYADSDQMGTISFMSFKGTPEPEDFRVTPYPMRLFRSLIAEAKDRGYVTQVTSVPAVQ
jgi:hypothetical protein